MAHETKQRRVTHPTFLRPDLIPLPGDAPDLYAKLRPVAKGVPIVKVAYEHISDEAYMWDAIPSKTGEEIDREWVEHRENFEKWRRYSYHTYGGYHGFFRPSLA